jgi:hypothetical protein
MAFLELQIYYRRGGKVKCFGVYFSYLPQSREDTKIQKEIGTRMMQILSYVADCEADFF